MWRCDAGQDCEFAGESLYVGQQLRGELGCLEHASWLKPTIAHCARSARKHRSREIIVTVEDVRLKCGTVEPIVLAEW